MATIEHLFYITAIFLLIALSNPFVSPVSAQDYLVGSQDVMKITVFDHPDLTTEARVSEDGRITFPLVGEIDVKNLSTRQVEQSIADRLMKSGMVKNPQVNVFIEQYMGSRVTIIGEVMKPGQYQISGPTTLLDGLALALGTNQNSGYILTVFRKEKNAEGKETTRKIPVDVDRLLNGGDLSLNMELQNGDVVYVPKAAFYIYGEVNRPGVYRLERGITVKRAIAIAGGLTPKGSEWRIEITHRGGEKETVAGVKIDDLVQFDDIIMVKESIF
ncbi:MAG TPA: polysaccharide biosynthesis/export family protein [Geobacteraceae bacterium]|nr:polysaccharide biosynthesis/export family protein [Geobacteraceae bacterium]